MTYAIPDGFALFIARWARTGDPEEMLNMFGVTPGAVIADDMDAFNDAVIATLLTQVTPSITYVGVTALIGNAGEAPPYDNFELIVNAVGLSGTYNLTPQNSAVLVHKNKAVGETGRSGRVYWPVLGENFCNNVGVLDVDVLIDLQGVWTDFFDALTAASLFPQIFRQIGAADTSPATVGNFTVDQLIATQRSRLRR